MYEEYAQEAINILRNNTPRKDQYDLSMLLESARSSINNSLLVILFKQIEKYRKFNYDDIDASKGNYEALKFYDDLEKTHKFLQDEFRITEELNIVLTAKKNIIKMRKPFEEGYQMDSDVVILLYESIVHAIVDATSTLITMAATSVVKTKEACSKHSLNLLRRFNKAVEKDNLQKAVRAANEQMFLFSGNKTVVKEEVFSSFLSVILTAGVILIFIPIIRELIFYFYFVRMKISDYLDQLSMYIKINEVEVRSNPEFNEAKKKEILEKQDKWIERLEYLSDKIRVNQVKAEVEAKEEIKKENSKVNVKKVKDTIVETEPVNPNPQGFDF